MGGSIGMMLLGIAMMLVGGALIETPIVGAEFGLVHIIAGIIFGAVFIIPGALFFRMGAKSLKEEMKDQDLEQLKQALRPEYEEVKDTTPLGSLLSRFRKHYSDYFHSGFIVENDPIQGDVTQIFRNQLAFRKQRLMRLGLTCEMTAKRMAYDRKSGISEHTFSDGKYDINEVTEEIAAKTVYKKDGKEIYSRMDKDIANYTVIHAKPVSDHQIICPNCGAVSTREALLDGCDYCGTTFTVEDLENRIAEFAFRNDYELEYKKYTRHRDRIIGIALACFIAAVVIFFIVLAFRYAPQMRAEGTGVILMLTAMIFAVIVASACFIPAFLIVYGGIIFPIVLSFVGLNVASKQVLKRLQSAPAMDKTFTKKIQAFDPNFSISNFYSSLQNKIASIIYADSKEQLEAFSTGDLSALLGKYENVVGMDVEYIGICAYHVDDKQHASVTANLRLTVLDGNKCRIKKTAWNLELAKSADCKTQVVCAPYVMTCHSCGASRDLLLGKRCAFCGQDLDLTKYDWAIEKIDVVKKKRPFPISLLSHKNHPVH